MRQIPFRDAYLRSSLSRNCTETEKYGIFFLLFLFTRSERQRHVRDVWFQFIGRSRRHLFPRKVNPRAPN